MVMRVMPDHTYDRMSLVAFLMLVVVLGLTFRDYGVTYDEVYRRAYGEHILSYYASFFGDRSALSYRGLWHSPGLADLAATVVAKLVPFGVYEGRHLFILFTGLLCIGGCWKVARLLGGPRAGFWSLIVVALSPSFYGHLVNNPKDIPFAAAYVWSLYFILQAVEHLPRIPTTLALKLGVALGAALGTRIGGAVLVVYVLGGAAVWLTARLAVVRNARSVASDAGRLASACLPAALVAYAIMLVGWPTAHHAPIGRPLKELAFLTIFPWRHEVLFKGSLVESTELPWDYLPVHLLVKLPELTLVSLMVGLVMIAVRGVRAERTVQVRFVLVAAAAFTPVLYTAITRPVQYDEMRHFLFIVPPISCLAGTAIAATLALTDAHQHLRVALTALVLAACALPVEVMVRLHPYQYVYYNSLVGGLRGAEGRYETDYWAHSYREAALLLAQYVKAAGRDRVEATPYKVAIAGPEESVMYYLPAGFSPASDTTSADFYVSYTRWRSDQRVEGKVIARVQRMGVTLSVVKDLRVP